MHWKAPVPRRVSSRGSSVIMLVYKISEKGGTIFIKSRTEKAGKRVAFLKKNPRLFLSHKKTFS